MGTVRSRLGERLTPTTLLPRITSIHMLKTVKIVRIGGPMSVTFVRHHFIRRKM